MYSKYDVTHVCDSDTGSGTGVHQADHPNATPAEVKSAIIVASTKDKIAHSQIDQKPGTPNRLLYSMVGGNDLVLAQVVASYFGPPGP